MGRPRILIAIKGLGLGGAEKLIADGARHWDRDRFDYSTAYALPWKDALVEALSDLNVTTTCVGSKRGFMPASWMRLRKLIVDAQIDLVHAHLPSIGIVCRLVSPVPVVYTEHNVAQSYRVPLQMANRATYGRNRCTIAVSDAVADSVAGYPGPTARVIPNAVDHEVSAGAARRARDELGIDDNVPLLVQVGNIRPLKGHNNLIAAVALLRDRQPDALVVSIGGEKHQGDLARLEESARAAGVSEQMTFLGSRPDALDFVAAADVFVNPSDMEGLPVAVLEAMGLAKPIVATAVGGVPGVIIDGETGVLVPPASPDALASAIDAMLDSPVEAEAMGENARELVVERHGMKRMVKTIEDVYGEVLGA